MSDKIKVINCKRSDNEYLHKDFHGALCYMIKYLDENFGTEATDEYLAQIGKTYFMPLSEKLKQDGLGALQAHWRHIFQKEQGTFKLYYENNKLVLEVEVCPAIAHLKTRGLFATERYCMTTRVVNKTICQEAGYKCSCDYSPSKGKCIQKFWKENDDILH